MTAYKNATSKNLKKQILSLYAFRYPAKTLQAIHSPYGKLSNWQIKQARSHALRVTTVTVKLVRYVEWIVMHPLYSQIFFNLSISPIILAKDLSISFLSSFITDSAFREKRLMNNQTNKINQWCWHCPQLQFLHTTGLDDDSPKITRNLLHREKERYWCE